MNKTAPDLHVFLILTDSASFVKFFQRKKSEEENQGET